MPRYVVLHHLDIPDPHYDLMLDPDGVSPLHTYRVIQWPPTESDRFTRIDDHRRIYLDYEGPISGGRGRVILIVRGIYNCCEETKDSVGNTLIDLDCGPRLKLPLFTKRSE
ncbi:MAG: hypothetical protein H7144_12845 [Burkholderiales bacterium]|nr:hypothetical protein [Phycisphaerae bacterium]